MGTRSVDPATSEQGSGASPAGPDDAIKTPEPPEEPRRAGSRTGRIPPLSGKGGRAVARSSNPGRRLAREGGGEQRWYHGAESAVLWFGRATPRFSVVWPGNREPAGKEPSPCCRTWYRRAPFRVGVLLSRVRVEEKLLLAELERRGVEIVRFDDREFPLDLAEPSMTECDVILERCINHLRALYTLQGAQRLGHPYGQHLRGRERLRRQAADHDGADPSRGANTSDGGCLHAGIGDRGDRGDGVPGRAQACRRLVGPAACPGQRPGRGRGPAGAQGDAWVVPPRRVLHPGVRREARPRYPRLRGRRRDDLRDLPGFAALDHQYRAWGKASNCPVTPELPRFPSRRKGGWRRGGGG